MEIGDKLDILYRELGKEKYESSAKVKLLKEEGLFAYCARENRDAFVF